MTRFQIRLALVAALLLAGGAAAVFLRPSTEPQRPAATAAVAPTAALLTGIHPTAIRPTTVPTATPTPSPSPSPAVRATAPAPAARPRVATPTEASSPTPTTSPTPSATPPSVPVELLIPAIELDAPVLAVGVAADGALGVPPDDASVGWYEFGAVPGQPGSAVLDGHVDSRTGPAIFYRLGELAPGDDAVVRLADGSAARYVVRETALYDLSDAPLARVFGPSARPQLVLITCGGPFDRAAGGYQQRRIVFAELAPP